MLVPTLLHKAAQMYLRPSALASGVLRKKFGLGWLQMVWPRQTPFAARGGNQL